MAVGITHPPALPSVCTRPSYLARVFPGSLPVPLWSPKKATRKKQAALNPPQSCAAPALFSVFLKISLSACAWSTLLRQKNKNAALPLPPRRYSCQPELFVYFQQSYFGKELEDKKNSTLFSFTSISWFPPSHFLWGLFGKPSAPRQSAESPVSLGV